MRQTSQPRCGTCTLSATWAPSAAPSQPRWAALPARGPVACKMQLRVLVLRAALTPSDAAQVRLHDAVALHLTPAHPKPSHADWRPWHGQPLFKRHEEDEGWWEERLQALA